MGRGTVMKLGGGGWWGVGFASTLGERIELPAAAQGGVGGLGVCVGASGLGDVGVGRHGGECWGGWVG